MADKPDQFPRSQALPSQSPLFWVEQKDRYLRQQMIRDIEYITGRPLVVAFGNRFVRGSEIFARDVAYLHEIISDYSGKDIDLVLETNGGVTDAAEALVSLLKATTSSYRIVVPGAAKSNGTLMALSAESIVMGVASELGPIEPHLNGAPVSTLLREEVKQINFALYIDASHALRQSTQLAFSFLRTGMMKDRDDTTINAVVNALSTRDSYPAHGSVIDRAEAQRLGLTITCLNNGDEFWDRIWLLYCMYDYDARRAGVGKIFEARSRSLSVAALPPAPIS